MCVVVSAHKALLITIYRSQMFRAGTGESTALTSAEDNGSTVKRDHLYSYRGNRVAIEKEEKKREKLARERGPRSRRH